MEKSLNKKLMPGMKRCKKCGKLLLTRGFIEKSRITYIMDKKKICHECAYWENIISRHPPNSEVLGTKLVRINPGLFKADDRTVRLGGKGKRRWFVRNDWSLIESNDIWVLGEIPERFRNRLKPTVREITKKAYNQFKRHVKQCVAVACMNRYKCFRYNMELEAESGAFNEVPSNWNPKDEHCGFYLPIDQVFVNNDNNNQTPQKQWKPKLKKLLVTSCTKSKAKGAR